jgi:ABC-type branched-subunit amino acid transport system ATPase component/ABC-type branched-subunit amino acid transport system permease subunit
VTSSALILGILEGLLIGTLSVGIVLVYRSNRFLNLAHGQLGAVSALLMAKFVIDWHWNYWLALPAALLVGAGVGVGCDRLIFRGLRARTSSTVALLLLSLGVSQILLAVTFIHALQPDQTVIAAKGYPLPFDASVTVGGVILHSQDLLVLIICPVLVGALGLLLRYSLLGKMIRAAASNPEWARSCGISPSFTSAVTWALAGALAAITAVLQSPSVGQFNAASLGPSQLFLALGAAAFGAFTSIPMALVGGLVIGVADHLALASSSNAGTARLVVFALVLGVIFVRGRLIGSVFATTGGGVDDLSPLRVPDAIRNRFYVRNPSVVTIGLVLLVGLLAPALPPFQGVGDRYLLATFLVYCIVAVSLTMVTGWGGQLSLGHYAVVGIGAYVAARMANHGYGIVPMYFVAGSVAALALVLIALPALRVRGFSLAVTSLGGGIVASEYLFHSQWFTASISAVRDVNPIPLVPNVIDASSQLGVYYVAFATLVVVALAASRLRRSIPGQLMIAVRDDERASAAYGITPTTVKLVLLAISGFFCGIAGVLWIDAIRGVRPEHFPPTLSLALVALPVIGGLGSVAGAISATALIYLPTMFLLPQVSDWTNGWLSRAFGDSGGAEFFSFAISGLGIALILLINPTGIAGTAQRLWQRYLDAVAAQLNRRRLVPMVDVPALAVEDVALSFGGVRALDGTSLHVNKGEIVGLIGTNGAGKSTLLNVISGVNTAERGRVLLDGRDLTGLSPDLRAAHGLGRTFQAAQLFPGLTVRQTVQAAIAVRRKIGVLSAMVRAPWAVRTERQIVAEAAAIVDRLGLSGYADTLSSDLSTGTRRICALAAQLGARPRVLLLDEPTAGVAQREAEAFGPLLRRIRAELDCAIVIVEHDMPLLMGLCDRVYAMEGGRVIAEGAPDEVRDDPRVVASYLGTDEKAIARSGTAARPPAPPRARRRTPAIVTNKPDAVPRKGRRVGKAVSLTEAASVAERTV